MRFVPIFVTIFACAISLSQALQKSNAQIDGIPELVMQYLREEQADTGNGNISKDIAEIDAMLEEVTDEVNEVLENDQTRDFLDKMLDESIALTEKEDSHESLQRVSGVVSQVSEILRHQDNRDLIMRCVKNIDSFFVDAKVHALVTGFVNTTHKLATDPEVRKLEHDALSAVEKLMDDEVTKARLGLAVVHVLRTAQSAAPLHLVVDGLKSLNTLVHSESSRSMVLTQLKAASATSLLR